MPSTVVTRFARLLVPCVFSVGLVMGCAEDPMGTPLLRGSGPEKPAKDAPADDAAAPPSGPTSPTGPAGGTPQDAVPTLSAIEPDALTLGAAPPEGIDLTLTGSRFAAGAQVDLAGTILPATVVSPTQLTVHLSSTNTNLGGVFRVMVLGSGGTKSNALTFTVANPTSVAITKLVPDGVTIGATGAVTLTITGSGFVPASKAKFNGAVLTTTFTSATQLTATIPTDAFLDAGRYGVTVSSGADVISLPTTFEVRNPAPQASSMTPRSAPAGAAGVSVTIDGTGFTRASTVLASGNIIVTSFVSATRLRATIPSGLLGTARTLSLVVQSPAPGGGTTNAQSFTVDAGAGGGGANCLYRCADYGYAPGQCFQDWYCIPNGEYAGCLGQTACN